MSIHQNQKTTQKQVHILTLFFAVTLILCGVFFNETLTQAIDLGQSKMNTLATQSGYSGSTTNTTLAENIGRIINIVLSMVGTIFLGITVYAGITWMTARGDESKADASQKMLRNAIIGLVITLGAYSITAFVLPQVLSRSTQGTGVQCALASAADCSGKPLGSSCGQEEAKTCKQTNQSSGICSCQ